MTAHRFEIVDGPDKPALQRALVYAHQGQTVVLNTEAGPLEIRLSEMTERGDGLEFDLKGTFGPGDYVGRAFKARYSVATRSGQIELAV